MTSPPDPLRRVADLTADAPDFEDAFGLAAPANDGAPPIENDGERPSEDAASLDPETRNRVALCAGLDPSDTDNGRRLIIHRGADLAVLMEIGGKASESTWLVWTGTHWDGRDGGKRAVAVAQTIGGLTAAEAEHLALSDEDAHAIATAQHARELYADALRDLHALDDDPDLDRAVKKREERRLKGELKRTRALIAAGAAAMAMHEKRKSRRRSFGVTTKNAGRINAMLAMAAPHLVTLPEAWDADQRLTYVANGVLRFSRVEDLDNPDPDAKRFVGVVEFTPEGWRRDDRVTRIVPTNYVPDASAVKWRAFLDRMMPSREAQLALQIFTGAGLTGVPIQRLMFHYGLGANGKSVFLETIMRVLGPLAEGLPPTSITGSGERGAGGASPDIAKLYGARFVRITELPQGDPLREELVKALTGGEKLDVRTLFKGYFSFQPQFKAHMSGNGYPYILGSDNGIWRRILMMPWAVTLAEHEQRDFEEVVGELTAEREGILAWMVEGMRLYDTHGLQITAEMRAAKEAYREEMDPVSTFFDQCVVVDETAGDLRATDFYERYCDWSIANSKKPFSQKRFGMTAVRRFQRKATREGSVYCNIRLANVPERPATHRRDEPPPHARNPMDEE